MRIKAIACALWFGLLPWQLYEKKKHYECSYLQHLWLNIKYACRWLFFKETESDREFERTVNGKFKLTRYLTILIDWIMILFVVGVHIATLILFINILVGLSCYSCHIKYYPDKDFYDEQMLFGIGYRIRQTNGETKVEIGYIR